MYCKKCFKIISDDSNFCNYCGSKVEAEPIIDEDTSEIEIPRMVRVETPVVSPISTVAPKRVEEVVVPEPARVLRRSVRGTQVDEMIQSSVEEEVRPARRVVPEPVTRVVEEEEPKRRFVPEDYSESKAAKRPTKNSDIPSKRKIKEVDVYEDDDDDYYDDDEDDEGLSILEIILLVISLVAIIGACIYFKPWNFIKDKFFSSREKVTEVVQEEKKEEEVKEEAPETDNIENIVEEGTDVGEVQEGSDEPVQEDGDSAPVVENKSEKKIEVLVENLRIRSTPEALNDQSNFKGTYVTKGKTYTVLEETTSGGYTWYRIGDDQWVAGKEGEWTKVQE